MTDQDEKLLLTDICARIPYGVMCDVDYYDDPLVLEGIPNTDTFLFCNGVIERYASQVRPYLRPISSMTKEEGKELEHIFCEMDVPCWVNTTYGCVTFASGNDFIGVEIAEVYTDWLNSHHFDYRGLIERGLALEAPEGMYN